MCLQDLIEEPCALQPTCKVRALVYLVTKKLVRLTAYASMLFPSSHQKKPGFFSIMLRAMLNDFGSSSVVAGNSSSTLNDDM